MDEYGIYLLKILKKAIRLLSTIAMLFSIDYQIIGNWVDPQFIVYLRITYVYSPTTVAVRR